MIDLEKACLDPASVFAEPNDVVLCQELSDREKRIILRQWRYDILDIEVAEDENMLGPNHLDILEKISKAFKLVGGETNPEDVPPTKQGA